MSWELVFWDAGAPESAQGILAECVLGNVRPTGNKGLPLTPSCRWVGSQESRVYGERGPVCKGLLVREFSHGAGGAGTRIWLFETEGELAKWRGSMCKGNVCWGHMCSKERCDEPSGSTNKRLTKCSRNGAVSFYKKKKKSLQKRRVGN